MLPPKPDNITGYELYLFEAKDIGHWIYKGGEGPAVVLLHELPGLTVECRRLADQLVADRFTVHMPLLFGKPESSATFRNMARVCIGREFYCFAAGQSSPIVDWVRALCRNLHEVDGGTDVGVFAITLLAEECVAAPITCQPSLPRPYLEMFFPRPRALAMSEAELTAARTEAARRAAPALLGFRFQGDRLCPAGKFKRLRDEFLDGMFEGHELPGDDHSVLTTMEFMDQDGHPTRQAYRRVVDSCVSGWLRSAT